ncbi:MAG: 30S ribosomal protein S20 [Candidatus Levybacteria bacterium]|nr:30S ribosomal protein S20 [Candidatus Levybacteria bacterium]
MPVIKSAKKKLRKDKIRTQRNSLLKAKFKKAVSQAIKKPSSEAVRKAVQLTDKIAKNKLIHKNKAARIKSRLSKLIKTAPKKKVAPKTPKTRSSKAKK